MSTTPTTTGETPMFEPITPPLADNACAPEAPARFTVLPGGIVRDNATGLEWTQDDVTETGVTHADAEMAVAACRIGGHDDWRLPTRLELFALVDETRYRPAIDTDAFPSCKNDWYWTSTPHAASPSEFAWVVNFSYGYADSGHRGAPLRVRAVRASSRQ